MRKIDKSSNTPQTLQDAPVPTKLSDVKASIYKAEDVRTQLCKDQHYKCAYCECSLTKAYNDVEHYRPKSIYYWLGHDWNNLLYSCPICNRLYKRINFPLKDESMRVMAPGDLSGEEPLIINPTNEDPAIHIKFNRYQMEGITEEGKKTIEVFHLNQRNELVHARKQLYELYKNQMDVLDNAKKNDEII
jgi:uncharacterized protein (TIGR02646 family)